MAQKNPGHYAIHEDGERHYHPVFHQKPANGLPVLVCWETSGVAGNDAREPGNTMRIDILRPKLVASTLANTTLNQKIKDDVLAALESRDKTIQVVLGDEPFYTE